ncbi:MAG: DUF134 domain-containing protein [Spirochaetota bacterium]
MARPKKERVVQCPPQFSSFKPAGIGRRVLERINLSLDEYEAVRLADYDQKEHMEAAELMGISRPTFTRLLESAHTKIAVFLAEGKALYIEGGSVHFDSNVYRCLHCGHCFPVPIDEQPSVCPHCKSDNLVDQAAGFGHGPCCRQFRGRRMYESTQKGE